MPHAFELLQAGKIPAAKKICRKILRADPTHADANNCLGVIYQRLGQPERAVPLFERALATDPGYIPAFGNLANSLAQLGQAG